MKTLGPLLAGLFAGIVLTVIVGAVWGEARVVAARGVGLGFGMGLGGVVGLIALNALVGYADKASRGG